MQDENRFRLDDFALYCQAREFRKSVYRQIRRLPYEEKYALDPQMRRAAISVSNNIAEGHGRWHWQENTRFCRISRGSIDEVLDDLNTCLDENYGDAVELNALKDQAYQLIARINSYIGYLQKCKQGSA
jgi:four helix bundle protein